MHIPDNYLSPQTDAVMAVAMVPVWIHCIKKVRATLDREHMAFLGICAAFSFLLMMFNVPLPGGTTGHAVGGALIALLLGPEAAAIAVSVALALQALLFGDGGILSFGANCFNMAFVLPFAAAIVFRALNSRLHDKSWGTSVSAIVSGWVGLCLAALCAAIEFGIQPMLFTNASGAPLYCPFPLSIAIPAMMIPHMLVAGVVEGVATAAIYGFIKKTAPSVIVGPEAADGQLAAEGAAAKKTSLVPTLILVAVLVVATPLGLLATGDAWGEWDAEGAATAVQEAGEDSLQASVGLDTPPFADALPTGDYLQAYSEEQGLGFAGQAAMYILSGVIGVAVLTIAFRLISLTVKDQYYNMREQVEPYPEVIGKAMQAMREAGVEPIVRPIRGGTDGARLSYMGLPCPNLFTGGMNFHGKFEYCSLDTMGRAVRTILNLARLWAE